MSGSRDPRPEDYRLPNAKERLNQIRRQRTAALKTDLGEKAEAPSDPPDANLASGLGVETNAVATQYGPSQHSIAGQTTDDVGTSKPSTDPLEVAGPLISGESSVRKTSVVGTRPLRQGRLAKSQTRLWLAAITLLLVSNGIVGTYSYVHNLHLIDRIQAATFQVRQLGEKYNELRTEHGAYAESFNQDAFDKQKTALESKVEAQLGKALSDKDAEHALRVECLAQSLGFLRHDIELQSEAVRVISEDPTAIDFYFTIVDNGKINATTRLAAARMLRRIINKVDDTLGERLSSSIGGAEVRGDSLIAHELQLALDQGQY